MLLLAAGRLRRRVQPLQPRQHRAAARGARRPKLDAAAGAREPGHRAGTRCTARWRSSTRSRKRRSKSSAARWRSSTQAQINRVRADRRAEPTIAAAQSAAAQRSTRSRPLHQGGRHGARHGHGRSQHRRGRAADGRRRIQALVAGASTACTRRRASATRPPTSALRSIAQSLTLALGAAGAVDRGASRWPCPGACSAASCATCEQVAATASRVADGVLERVAHDQRNDELGDLLRAQSTMVERLRRMVRQVQRERRLDPRGEHRSRHRQPGPEPAHRAGRGQPAADRHLDGAAHRHRAPERRLRRAGQPAGHLGLRRRRSAAARWCRRSSRRWTRSTQLVQEDRRHHRRHRRHRVPDQHPGAERRGGSGARRRAGPRLRGRRRRGAQPGAALAPRPPRRSRR